jgi:hypothetical protein
MLYMKTIIRFWSYLAHFFLEWGIFRTKVVEKIKTHFIFNNFFFGKPCRLWENVEIYCRAGQAADEYMVHALCVLDTWGYSYALRVCNTFCFSTATLLAKTRLVVTLYVHCLSSCSYLHVICVTASSVMVWDSNLNLLFRACCR